MGLHDAYFLHARKDSGATRDENAVTSTQPIAARKPLFRAPEKPYRGARS